MPVSRKNHYVHGIDSTLRANFTGAGSLIRIGCSANSLVLEVGLSPRVETLGYFPLPLVCCSKKYLISLPRTSV
ncbi:hypothetical protein ACFL2Q_19320, partial [Thermodesulfobacteriota bacterium]